MRGITRKISYTGQGTGTVTPTQTNPVDGDRVECVLDVTAASGTPTLDVTPQWSQDGTLWVADTTVFTQATGVTTEQISLTSKGKYLRFSAVVAGTTPSFDFDIHTTEFGV